MTDERHTIPSTAPATPPGAGIDTGRDVSLPLVAEALGVGAQLRELRTRQNVSLVEVSMRLKYSQRQLAALEEERWELLPGGMSLRGLVRNYVRYLDGDAQAMLQLLDEQVGTAPPPGAGDRTLSSRDPGSVPLDEEAPRGHWGWSLVILALVLVAVFYAIQRGWVPDSWLVFDWLKSLKK
ncbi:MAG: helix-turn-helix domain-containing protein [Castellaniella sp.]